MNKNLMIASGVLVVAGVVGVLQIGAKQGGKEDVGAEHAGGNKAGKVVSGEEAAVLAKRSAQERLRAKQEARYRELVEKYGEARTNLSKSVTANMTGIMEDVVEMYELMSANAGGGFGGGAGMMLGSMMRDLELSPEQKASVDRIYQEHQKRQTERYRAAVEKLKQDPTPLMQLTLASDANASGKLSDEEYQKIQLGSQEELAGVINPLDRKNMGGGSPLRDEDFIRDMKGVLDAKQAEKFNMTVQKVEEERNANQGLAEGSMSRMGKMNLEKLDTSIQSARKITTGIKSMMDGMNGMKDLMPPPQSPPAGEPAGEK